MVRWIFFPTSLEPNDYAFEIVDVFKKNSKLFNSEVYKRQTGDIVIEKIRKKTKRFTCKFFLA